MHKHEKLGLDFQTYGALLATRTLLARGDLKHTEDGHSRDASHKFNMAVPCTRNEHCGSVSCIGGTMALIMGLPSPCSFVDDPTPPSLHELFFPPDEWPAYEIITTEQAIQAIDNFIKYNGDPKWHRVLGIRKSRK